MINAHYTYTLHGDNITLVKYEVLMSLTLKYNCLLTANTIFNLLNLFLLAHFLKLSVRMYYKCGMTKFKN